MKNTIGLLDLPQREFNRQVLKLLDEANSGDANAIKALQTAIGDKNSGLIKDVNDVKTAIGDESTAGSILGRIKALEDAS